MNSHSFYAADHASFHIGANYMESNIQTKQFICSIDTAIFVSSGMDTQKKIDVKMAEIATSILGIRAEAREKNGIRIKRNGERVQKYRNRRIYLSSLSIFYHNRHPDASKSVNPHFHIIFPSNMRLGKRYVYLKFALSEIAKKYSLKFHFMEDKNYSGLTKKQEYFIRNSIMKLQRNRGALLDLNVIRQVVTLLKRHYLNTRNIAYFIKQINTIHNYLNKNSIDFYCDDCNLKNEMFLYMTDSQIKKIADIKEGNVVEIGLDNVFDRELIKYANNFKSEAMEAISQVFAIEERIWREMKYTISMKSNKRKIKDRDKQHYSRYYFTAEKLLEVTYSQDVFLTVEKPILLDYIKKYSQLYDIAVLESKDTIIAIYPGRIVLKETADIKKAVEDISNFFSPEKYDKMGVELTGDKDCIRLFEKHIERLKANLIPIAKPRKKKIRMMSR